MANNGLGNNVMALDFAKTALEMEPNNQTYQRLVQTLESGGQWYNTRQYSYGGDSGAMCCADPCTTLCLLNAIAVAGIIASIIASIVASIIRF
ncbi:MAG: hypothetical protein ACLUR5_08235 [Eubacterium ventriosum]